MFGLVILITAVVVVLVHLLLKTNNWSVTLNNNVALVTSIIGGVVSIVVQNGGLNFPPSNLLASVVLVYGASQAVYKVLVAPTGLDTVFTDKIGFTSKTAAASPEPLPAPVQSVDLSAEPKHAAPEPSTLKDNTTGSNNTVVGSAALDSSSATLATHTVVLADYAKPAVPENTGIEVPVPVMPENTGIAPVIEPTTPPVVDSAPVLALAPVAVETAAAAVITAPASATTPMPGVVIYVSPQAAPGSVHLISGTPSTDALVAPTAAP
jgi:hypothetical protein